LSFVSLTKEILDSALLLNPFCATNSFSAAALKQSFLLLLQRMQVQTNMMRLSAKMLAAVMAEVSGMGAEMYQLSKFV